MDRDEILKLPEIPRGNVRWLWYSNYWDGVLSGMLLYNGQKYWFCCFDEAMDHIDYDYENDLSPSTLLGWYRRFAVIEITQDQIKEAEYWHSLFMKYVGVHTTFDENEKKPLIKDMPKYTYRGIPCADGMADPNKYWGLYYKLAKNSDKNKTDFNTNDGKVIGWFHN